MNSLSASLRNGSKEKRNGATKQPNQYRNQNPSVVLCPVKYVQCSNVTRLHCLEKLQMFRGKLVTRIIHFFSYGKNDRRDPGRFGCWFGVRCGSCGSVRGPAARQLLYWQALRLDPGLCRPLYPNVGCCLDLSLRVARLELHVSR